MKPRPTVITVCLILIFHCVNEVDAADCNRTAPQPITHIELPGNPFAPVPTSDGCWIFVSLARTQSKPGRIAVLKRDKGNVSIVRTVPVEDSPAGMVMTHDGKILIASVDERVAFLDSQRVISGLGTPVLGYWTDEVINASRTPSLESRWFARGDSLGYWPLLSQSDRTRRRGLFPRHSR